MRGLVLALTVGAAALTTALGSPILLWGAPVISIRSRSAIELEPVLRSNDGLQVRGTVVDELNREGVAGAVLVVRMGNQRQRVRTDDRGRFRALIAGDSGRDDIEVRHVDDDRYAGSEARLADVDLGKQLLRLEIRANNFHFRDDAIEIEVQATTSDNSQARITAEVFAGPVGGQLEATGQITTSDSGRARYQVPRGAFAQAGRKRVQVRFAGDRAFFPAEAHADIVLTTDTETTMDIGDQAIAYEDAVTVAGRVTDEAGNGVPRGPVVLRNGIRALRSVMTDADGLYETALAGSEIGQGKFNLQAVFEPAEPWFRTSRSHVHRIEVAEPQPFPIRSTLAAFGATLLAMVTFVLLRSRIWWRAVTWLSSRLFKKRPSRQATADSSSGASPPDRGGLKPAKTSAAARLRRANVREFSGNVRDALTSRPIAGAVIIMRQEGTADLQSFCDAEGAFIIEDIADGVWDIEVMADSYVRERFRATMPHHGELRGARITLVPVRERIFAMYREVAQPHLPSPDKWGVWTPRQIFEHVRKRTPSAPGWGALTDFVEDAYFSQRLPEEAALAEAARRIEAARAETSAGPSASA